MKDKYESEMLEVIHEDMKGLHKLGIVSDAEMRKFDKLCITKEPKTTHKTASPVGTRRNVRISAKGAN